MNNTRQEITYLKSLLQQLSVASLTDIEEIREELIEQGMYAIATKNNVKRKKRKASFSLLLQ